MTRWPPGSGSRSASMSVILVALILGSVYRGSITAFLAIPFRETPVNSIEELVASDINPALRTKNLVYQAMMSEGGYFHKVDYHIGVFSGAQTTSWDFFKMVADGTYALIDVYSSAVGRANRYEERGKRCRFYLGRVPVKTDMDAFAFVKNSPIKYQFDYCVRWLRYFGLLQHIKKKYYSVSCEAEIPSNGPQPMSLMQAQGAFYVMGVGLLASLLVFLFELISEHFKWFEKE